MLFRSWSLMVYMAHQPDGEVLLAHTEPLATRLTDLARQHTNVYNVLKKIVEANVYTALAAEVGAIATAIAQNHGVDANPVTLIKGFFGAKQPTAPDTRAISGTIPA